MREATSVAPAARSDETETSLIEVVNGLLRNWRAVLAFPFVLAVAVGAVSLSQSRTYAATASFVTQSVETRELSGAAVLAQQFGISLGTDGAGQAPQFYEDLLRSVTILRRAIETEYHVRSEAGESRRATLVQHWRLNEQDDPTPAWRRGVDRLRRSISTSVRRETGVIELTVFADDPLLAEQIATRLLELLNDHNLAVRQARAQGEADFVTGRLAEAQGELRTAEDALEAFLRENRDFSNSPNLTFQHDRLQRQVLALQEVYTALLRAREQARLDGMRDTPVLQIIDSPAGSSQPQSRNTALRTVIAFLLGLLLAIGLSTVREAGRRARLNNDPYYEEFGQLVRSLWSDIRHPRRWLGRKREDVASEVEGT